MEKYPLITFILTGLQGGSVSAAGEETELLLLGVLHLHGIARSIAIPVTARLQDLTLLVKGAVTLKLSDYQIERPQVLFLTVRDEVTVLFEITAREQGIK